MKKYWHRYQRYKELELIPDQPQLKSQLSRLQNSRAQTSHSLSALDPSLLHPPAQRPSWLKRLWEALDVAFLRSLEPRVWQTVDATGQSHWHLYDPETGKTYHLNSEAEVRCWLQQVFDASPEAEPQP